MENYFIKLWGTPTLRENGRSLPLNEILGKQLTELLCYFLIHRGELVSHDRLIELFWPESVNPQNALKFAVHRLRKLTQPYAEGTGMDRDGEAWLFVFTAGAGGNRFIPAFITDAGTSGKTARTD